ncbi:MAG: AGE family epimerase/isomerase [Gaiellaceae bacterium]
MSVTAPLLELSTTAERELRENILPFWAGPAVDERGGFQGLVAGDMHVDPLAPKGCVLNARILWTFSAAYRRWPQPLYREMADRAFDYLLAHFWDERHSGLVWTVDHEGRILEGRKQVYGLAFGIYALAEYARASASEKALDRAVELFRLIEKHAFDEASGGYGEALGRDWKLIDDVRLSARDLNAPRSQNTHLHLLEAYAGLVRSWDDPAPRARLRALIEILVGHIRDERTDHLILFQDEGWRPLSRAVSYGHDIEASWLLSEAAALLGDDRYRHDIDAVALRMAERVLDEGYDREHGGIFNESAPGGELDSNKDWWVEAEAVVGFLNGFQLSGRARMLDAALETWRFIEAHMVDRVHGSWFSRVSREGSPHEEMPKVDLWTCPYHSARAALEIIDRTGRRGGR